MKLETRDEGGSQIKRKGDVADLATRHRAGHQLDGSTRMKQKNPCRLSPLEKHTS